MTAVEDAGGAIHWLQSPDGLRLRAAHWPQGGRGTVLLLNGRSEFIEKYLETVQALQARRFAVWTMDWRGQGASARMLPDRAANHVARFDDYLDDAGLLLDRHVLPGLGGRPLVVLAHSMGGHLAARLLARRPSVFARAILCAPMIDFLRGGPIPHWLAHTLARLVCLRPGQATRYGPGPPRAPELHRVFEGNRLTSCPIRHEADLELMRSAPSLAVGGVTWGWLRAALASIAALDRAETRRRITMPVLVALAGADRLVDNRAARRFTAGLPRGTLLELPDARHELLREHDRHRGELWAAIDEFLRPVGDDAVRSVG